MQQISAIVTSFFVYIRTYCHFEKQGIIGTIHGDNQFVGSPKMMYGGGSSYFLK